MRNLSILVGAALLSGAGLAAPVAALPLVAGANAAAQTKNPLIEQVQARRNGVVRAPVGRVGAVRGGGGRVVYGRRGGGGIGPGGAAAIGLGVLGVAAAAAVASQQPYYYEDAPVCGVERQPVYDRFGNYRGTRAVRVCD